MSYEVTATRRRPQQFDDLVGQEFVAETLKNSIKSGKIAHAYLFAGPRGCGKTSTARILAKALNCQNGPTDSPCGTCSNCQEITKGTSLDVIEIDGASNTSVENIRQIKDEVLFPPSNAKYKIYIIDEVHMLSTSAFNALLKTIEEPPPYVIFIFATTELQKVPATIKSRCQQYNFRLVAIDKVKQCLADAAAELNIQADDEALFWIARESTGSMRDAYTLFDQIVAFSDGHITYEKIRDKLGLVGIDRLNTIFEACANNQTEQVIDLLDQFLQGGISIEQLISNCADYLRSLLLIKAGVKKESLLGNSPERYSNIVLMAWNSVQIERALSIFLQLYRDIRYSLSPRYELELAFSRLCWIGQYVSNTEVKKAIDAAQALLSGAPVGIQPVKLAMPATQPAMPVAPATPVAPVMPVAPAPVEPQPAPVVEPVAAEPVPSPIQEEPVAPPPVAPAAPVPPVTDEGIAPIPAGLPRLSMLDEIESELDEPAPEGEDEPNPFLNGGPLPPEQSVEQSSNPVQPAELDERLIIHIPEANVSAAGEVVPTVVIPQSETGYSLNPDAEDDGWSNVDEPPLEEYYPDESELAAQVEQSYEQSITSGNGNNAPVQLNDTFTKPDGTTMTVAQLRGSVMAALSITDGFAASILEKTGQWTLTQDAISTIVTNNYDLELIQQKTKLISEEISKIYGKAILFKVSLQQVQEENNDNAPVELPAQVQILVNAFKGSIVAGKQ